MLGMSGCTLSSITRAGIPWLPMSGLRLNIHRRRGPDSEICRRRDLHASTPFRIPFIHSRGNDLQPLTSNQRRANAFGYFISATRRTGSCHPRAITTKLSLCIRTSFGAEANILSPIRVAQSACATLLSARRTQHPNYFL